MRFVRIDVGVRWGVKLKFYDEPTRLRGVEERMRELAATDLPYLEVRAVEYLPDWEPHVFPKKNVGDRVRVIARLCDENVTNEELAAQLTERMWPGIEIRVHISDDPLYGEPAANVPFDVILEDVAATDEPDLWRVRLRVDGALGAASQWGGAAVGGSALAGPSHHSVFAHHH